MYIPEKKGVPSIAREIESDGFHCAHLLRSVYVSLEIKVMHLIVRGKDRSVFSA